MPLNPEYREVEAFAAERLEVAADEDKTPWVGGMYGPTRFVWDERILPALREKAEKENTPVHDYRARLLVAADIICNLHAALHADDVIDKDKSNGATFWVHQKFEPVRAHDASRGFAIDRAELLQVAAQYVRHPEIQNNPIDWYLLDALVFAELDAFTEQFMSGALLQRINLAWVFADHNLLKYSLYSLLFGILGFALRYALPPTIVIYLGISGHEVASLAVAGVWILYVITRFSSVLQRRKASRKAEALMTLMAEAYSHLASSVISPTRFRDPINKAAAGGVVFDGALFAIADRVARRDETAFVPFAQ